MGALFALKEAVTEFVPPLTFGKKSMFIQSPNAESLAWVEANLYLAFQRTCEL